MGDAAWSLEYISGETRGGRGGRYMDCRSSLDLTEMGYSYPNSEKYQSGMSVVDIAPTDITGLRRETAEKKSGNCPTTICK